MIIILNIQIIQIIKLIKLIYNESNKVSNIDLFEKKLKK